MLGTFGNQYTISAVNRMVYSGSPSKGTMIDQSLTYPCYLRPLSEEEASLNAMQWGTAFIALLDIDAGILKADILTIDGADYTVRGVSTFAPQNSRRQTSYMKLLIVKVQA